ncbi:CHAT domain-containing protein [candidate division GN15 bacterium]|nr:CHAT domain-containing protein [candidate division GN15 bacterium]
MPNRLSVLTGACALIVQLVALAGPAQAADPGLLLKQADSLYAVEAYDAARELVPRIGAALEPVAADSATMQDARTWLEYGVLLVSLSEFTRADTALQQAVELAEQAVGPSDTLFAEFLSVLASLYRTRGDLDRAEAVLKRSLAIHKSWGKENELMVTAGQIRLASLYLYMHRIDEIEPLLRSAYDIRVAHLGKDHEFVATVLSLQAGLRELQGRPDEAEQLYLQALAILRDRKGPDYAGVARIQTALGTVYRSQGRYDESQRAYDKAIEIYSSETNNMIGATAGPYARLGWLFMDQGRYREADSCIRIAQDIRRQHPGVGEIYFAYGEWQLGQVATRMGQLDEAESSLLSALPPIRETLGPLHPTVFRVQADLANLYAVQGNWERSVSYYHTILKAQRSVTRAWFAVSSEHEKLSWIRKYPLVDPALVTIALASGRRDAIELAGDMVLTGKGAVIDALAVQSESIYCSTDETTRSLWEQRADLCSEVAGIAMGHFPPELSRRVNDTLVQLYRVLDSLEAALSRSCSRFEDRLLRDDARIGTIRDALRDGSVLWEFVKYEPLNLIWPAPDQSGARYAAFVIAPKRETLLLDLGEARVIDSVVVAIRASIADIGHAVYGAHGPYLEAQLQRQLADLHQLVIAPLAAHSGSSSFVYVAPDGALNLIPFGITVDRNGAYALESTAFHYVASGRELLGWHNPEPNSGTAIVMADPAFDSHPAPVEDPAVTAQTAAYRFNTTDGVAAPHTGAFARLPFTRTEAEEVVDVLREYSDMDVQTFLGARAGETVLRSLTSPPRLLHLATHGFMNATEGKSTGAAERHNPLLRAGLAFAGANRRVHDTTGETGHDGILTALEATALQLYGTELVTLSACESGLGDVMAGEGVFGLSRAFVHAGADAVMMSLWRIADAQTARLMRGFYAEWLGGKSKQEALRQAMLSMLKAARTRHGHGHPALWAGFVLAGNPD